MLRILLVLVMLTGVLSAVGTGVQGAGVVARLRQQRGHHLEVPLHGQDGRAAGPQRESAPPLALSRRNYSGKKSLRRVPKKHLLLANTVLHTEI